MKKIISVLLLFSAIHAFCELPILRTSFRKADLKTVQSHAEQNNADAQVELAQRYYAGYQVKQDSKQAFKWMSKAAEAGNSDAQFLLSRMYAEGIGTKADEKKSEEWLAKAIAADPKNEELQALYKNCLSAKQADAEATKQFLKLCADAGYAPAFIALWKPVAMGMYSEGDYKEAVKLFQQLADRGNPEGMYLLSRMYSSGQGGLPEDHTEAFDLCRKAAEGGCADAQYELARMYDNGIGIGKNSEKAAEWYEKAAQDGYAAAQYKMAEMDFASAFRWSEQAAIETEGSVAAELAEQSYRQNLAKAVKWYQKAAEGENADAQYMLGRLYASGEGVSRNFDTAVQYYKQAAEQGNTDALFYIGLMYHAGLGLSKDVGKAVFFYQQAAERGSRAAMFYLGNCYFFGNGVEQNAKKGESFYREKTLEGVNPLAGNVEESDLLKNIWVFRAAKEYGAVLWRKSVSDSDDSLAREWMSLAARSGDSQARGFLVKMATCRRSGSETVIDRSEISGSPVDPRKDAMAKRRDSVLLFPYMEENIKDLYPDFQSPQIFSSMKFQENAQSITGDKLWELAVKYQYPAVDKAVGLQGVLMVGLEFEDSKTGEKYWTFNEVQDLKTAFSGGAYTDVSVFVNLSRYSDLRLSDWAVAYGHLIDDARTLAVLTERKKSGASGSFEDMFLRNRFSGKLDSIVAATVDITGTMQSATISSENTTPTGNSSSTDNAESSRQ